MKVGWGFVVLVGIARLASFSIGINTGLINKGEIREHPVNHNNIV